ncbi:MAG: hypothetical protein QG630_483 [Patescibacteria group bacterium]|nr:hypothetical protein [Patescibacteria group bacterium]
MHTKTIKYTSPEEKFKEEILKAINKYNKGRLSENIRIIR